MHFTPESDRLTEREGGQEEEGPGSIQLGGREQPGAQEHVALLVDDSQSGLCRLSSARPPGSAFRTLGHGYP